MSVVLPPGSLYSYTKNLEPITQITELLLTSCTSWGSEDELCTELPFNGHVPGLLNAGIDQGVIMLQVGA